MTSPTVAQVWARALHARGVRRAYGLTGSHVKPIWDELTRLGVEIIGVRHEQAAVHMAHAAAEITGELGVAILTCGPGFTNGLSGMATAQHARVPIIVLSAIAPSQQLGRGAFEETPQATLAAPLCKYSDTVTDPDDALAAIDAAIDAALGGAPGGKSAAFGNYFGAGVPGPSYLDAPVDILRSPSTRHLAPTGGSAANWRQRAADDDAIAAAVAAIAAAKRPVVISGGGAKGAAKELQAFVDAIGSVYLDTRETRGLLPTDYERYVPAMRGRVMSDADLIITVGRRLDYELAYGSPAIYADGARFLRIGVADEHLHDNRDDATKLAGDLAVTLPALTAALTEGSLDKTWVDEVLKGNRFRVDGLAAKMAAEPAGTDGRMHPNRLLAAVNDVIDDNTIVIGDGGDILSFTAVGIRAQTLLTPGPFGCIGSGVPFGIATSLEAPERQTIVIVGDGSFGFNALELDTAVRHNAKVVVVIANNEAWGIENRDRVENYDDAPFTTQLPGCRYDLLAQSLGAHGERVDNADDLPAALQRALANAPAVIDVAVTLEAVSPDFKNGLADLGDHHALRAWNDLEQEYRNL